MTSTAIISAVNTTTAGSPGPFNSTKTTLQATTSFVKISCKLVLASGNGGGLSTKLRVRHAVSQTSYGSALLGALALVAASEYVDLPLTPAPGTDTVELHSEGFVTAAGYHYCWIELPLLPIAGTITVFLEELP